MRILFYFFILGLFGCNKPNPNPELTDQIFQDLQSQTQNTQREIDTEKKKLEELKKELNAVTPQTGMLKHLQKKYFESEVKIQKLEQLRKYYEIKSESRRIYTKGEYLKAFQTGKPWPTQEELTSYKQYKESLNYGKSWNSRERVKNYEKQNGISSVSTEISKKQEKKAETQEKVE
ncbi:MAG: hypothetical protein ACXWRE_00610 [Pseudobdellovibrionaceae bacterium]